MCSQVYSQVISTSPTKTSSPPYKCPKTFTGNVHRAFSCWYFSTSNEKLRFQTEGPPPFLTMTRFGGNCPSSQLNNPSTPRPRSEGSPPYDVQRGPLDVIGLANSAQEPLPSELAASWRPQENHEKHHEDNYCKFCVSLGF